jgi:hypothetical protein
VHGCIARGAKLHARAGIVVEAWRIDADGLTGERSVEYVGSSIQRTPANDVNRIWLKDI